MRGLRGGRPLSVRCDLSSCYWKATHTVTYSMHPGTLDARLRCTEHTLSAIDTLPPGATLTITRLTESEPCSPS